jgi:hypothetical protein
VIELSSISSRKGSGIPPVMSPRSSFHWTKGDHTSFLSSLLPWAYFGHF